MLLFDHATRVTWKVTSPSAAVDRVRGAYIIRRCVVAGTRKSKRFTCTCIVDAQSNLHAERPRILIRSSSVSSSRLSPPLYPTVTRVRRTRVSKRRKYTRLCLNFERKGNSFILPVFNFLRITRRMSTR